MYYEKRELDNKSINQKSYKVFKFHADFFLKRVAIHSIIKYLNSEITSHINKNIAPIIRKKTF